LTFVPHSFVANFVSYIAAKCYLNWFSFHIIIVEEIRVSFCLKHGVYIIENVCSTSGDNQCIFQKSYNKKSMDPRSRT